MQLFECAIATKSPIGVVTISNSLCNLDNSFSRTTIANAEVPADTFPVFLAILLVATIPVPASPSGGQSFVPDCNLPVGSKSNTPSAVNVPASSPATKTFGRISSSVHEYSLEAINELNFPIISLL